MNFMELPVIHGSWTRRFVPQGVCTYTSVLKALPGRVSSGSRTDPLNNTISVTKDRIIGEDPDCTKEDMARGLVVNGVLLCGSAINMACWDLPEIADGNPVYTKSA